MNIFITIFMPSCNFISVFKLQWDCNNAEWLWGVCGPWFSLYLRRILWILSLEGEPLQECHSVNKQLSPWQLFPWTCSLSWKYTSHYFMVWKNLQNENTKIHVTYVANQENRTNLMLKDVLLLSAVSSIWHKIIFCVSRTIWMTSSAWK